MKTLSRPFPTTLQTLLLFTTLFLFAAAEAYAATAVVRSASSAVAPRTVAPARINVKAQYSRGTPTQVSSPVGEMRAASGLYYAQRGSGAGSDIRIFYNPIVTRCLHEWAGRISCC